MWVKDACLVVLFLSRDLNSEETSLEQISEQPICLKELSQQREMCVKKWASEPPAKCWEGFPGRIKIKGSQGSLLDRCSREQILIRLCRGFWKAGRPTKHPCLGWRQTWRFYLHHNAHWSQKNWRPGVAWDEKAACAWPGVQPQNGGPGIPREGFLIDLNKDRSQVHRGCPSWCLVPFSENGSEIKRWPVSPGCPSCQLLSVGSGNSCCAQLPPTPCWSAPLCSDSPLSTNTLLVAGSPVTASLGLHPWTMIELRTCLSPKLPDKEWKRHSFLPFLTQGATVGGRHLRTEIWPFFAGSFNAQWRWMEGGALGPEKTKMVI